MIKSKTRLAYYHKGNLWSTNGNVHGKHFLLIHNVAMQLQILIGNLIAECVMKC